MPKERGGHPRGRPGETRPGETRPGENRPGENRPGENRRRDRAPAATHAGTAHPAGRQAEDDPESEPGPFHSGFACFVGRPNVGKSTLTNALVGEKIAITSTQPQTTRHTIRGVLHRRDAQLVIVDTPGLHRPQTLLGQRLNDLVRATLAEVDVVAMCLAADQPVGPGDRFVAAELARLSAIPVLAVVTRTDLVRRDDLAVYLGSVQDLGTTVGLDWDAIVPVCAPRGTQISLLADLLVAHLPPGPALYPAGEVTDEPEAVMVAELIREAALEGVRDELPHSLAVVVDEMLPRPDRPKDRPLLDVRATVFVERDSQKGIVIGHRGARLRDVGIGARQTIEAMLATQVHLDLHVKVAKDWQRDPKQLRRLGF